MTLEKIAAKLQPLMPEKVSHWLRARELADPELKSLIEKQLIATTYKTLGDFNSKILLSLPPEQRAQGPINLGTVLYDKEKWPVGISTNELMQNMAILGRSGSGKTNVSFHILAQLIERKIPFLFLDWKRTVRHLLPQFKGKINVYTPGRSLINFPFNPFVVPPGIEAHVYIDQVVDVMRDAFALGDGSGSLIRKAIALLYEQNNHSPTVEEIIAEIEKVPDTGRQGGWKITALRALESLAFSDLSAKSRISQGELATKLLHENSVIELDSLGQSSKKFLVPLLCLWLYYVRLNSIDREQLKLVIFIEEAHHVLHKRAQTSSETALEMLFRQCRELGIGIIVIDQHPHLLSSAALGNTYTTICLNQKDPSDINKAAAISLLDAEDKKYFSMLPVGQAIIKLQDRWPKPFLVQFPLMNVKKGLVTDEVISRVFSENSMSNRHSPRNISLGPEFDAFSPILPPVILDNDALMLLCDVINYPNDSVTARYQRLDIGVKKGHRLKEQLVRNEWLEAELVELGHTRKLLLRPTKKAKQLLKLNDQQPTNYGSLIHEYWKWFYTEKFKAKGYQVMLEYPRASGQTDVVAKKDEEKIAIEIETGKSDYIRNLKQSLLANFDKIIIVATSPTAFKQIERCLIVEGLLMPVRVELVLRG